jgi:hypothetical protein
MLEKDVKVGDRVVPFRKTVAIGINGLYSWDDWNNRFSEFFEKNGYVTISEISGNLIWIEETAGCFNISDVEPYEPAKDNNSKHPLIRHTTIQGNRLIMTLRDGRIGEAMRDPSEPWDDLKANVIALARALGQEVDDIEIVINPQPKTQDKPTEDTFEVGETVRVRADLTAGKSYNNILLFYGSMSDLKGKEGKITADLNDGCYVVFGFSWDVSMLEKVPQPTKHEVIIDGKEWMPKP